MQKEQDVIIIVSAMYQMRTVFFYSQVPVAVAHSEFWQRYFYRVFQLDQVIMLFYVVYPKMQTILKMYFP